MSTVTVHALAAGHLTLPERHFVVPHDPEASRYAPSLSFLIQHTTVSTGRTTRILFDLGIRRDLDSYPQTLRKHFRSREIESRPDVVESLSQGGLTPDDIDYVIFSHVHYDHVGYPNDFGNPTTRFIIGPGAHSVLSGQVKFPGTHSIFEPDLLPPDRSIELPSPISTTTAAATSAPIPAPNETAQTSALAENSTSTPLKLSHWTALAPLAHVMDIFGDSSVYIVNAPGHLPGHLNLLCRLDSSLEGGSQATSQGNGGSSNETTTSQRQKYVYLAGDSFHDARLLQGTHSIAAFETESGDTCTIHADVEAAQQTIATIRQIRDQGIGIVDPTSRNSGTGLYMNMGDQRIEIQKGWFGDPRAQDPGRMDEANAPVTRHADVEIVFAHDEVWEKDALDRKRFWPGQL